MWIARDKEGNLMFWDCTEKPVRVCDCTWACRNHIRGGYLDNQLFPNLKWEDEPLEVNLIPVHSISEDELNNLADKNNPYEFYGYYETQETDQRHKTFNEGFKVGYRTALKNK